MTVNLRTQPNTQQRKRAFCESEMDNPGMLKKVDWWVYHSSAFGTSDEDDTQNG